MGMYRLEFKANIITASKNTRDNYYMVGLADDKYHYTNYVFLLFYRLMITVRLMQMAFMPNAMVR